MSKDLREAAEHLIRVAQPELFDLKHGHRRMADCPGLIELGRMCSIAKETTLVERITSFRDRCEDRNSVDKDLAWKLLMEALIELQDVPNEFEEEVR